MLLFFWLICCCIVIRKLYFNTNWHLPYLSVDSLFSLYIIFFTLGWFDRFIIKTLSIKKRICIKSLKMLNPIHFLNRTATFSDFINIYIIKCKLNYNNNHSIFIVSITLIILFIIVDKLINNNKVYHSFHYFENIARKLNRKIFRLFGPQNISITIHGCIVFISLSGYTFRAHSNSVISGW